MHVSNSTIGLLRKLADDDRNPTAKRLQAIDALAAYAGLYFTAATRHCRGYAGRQTRARRAVIRLLRKLRRSPKFIAPVHRAAIDSRLLFIKGVSIGKNLTRPDGTSPEVTRQTTKTADSEAARLRRLIEQYGVKS
jgi:hypothetical protein